MNTVQTGISERAFVHPDAKLGPNVTVAPFATIDSDVEIGEGSWIGPNAVVQDGARIGKNVKIFPGAIIASIPQDLKFQGEYTTTVIKDGAMIREFATINRGTTYADTTIISENALVMAYAHVAHDCIVGRNSIIANTVNLAGHVIVEDFAIIGGSCAVHQFARIGRHAFVAGGSLVRKDVPPYILAAREPLMYAGVNHRGLARRGYSSQAIRNIQEIYRRLFLADLNTTQALVAIEESFPDDEVRGSILSFVRQSQRGLIRGYTFQTNGRA